MKKRLPGLISLAVLAGIFLTVRFPLLFLHGMKEWPLDLFAVGAVVIALSGILFRAKLLPALTAAGYLLGFAAGCLLHQEYAPGRDDLWILWTGVFLALMLVGGILEFLVCRRRKSSPPQKSEH